MAVTSAAVFALPAVGVQLDADPVAITGGERVAECGWPSTVWMNGCTGTLIGPQHVIFAAHCAAPNEAFFGEDASSGGESVRVERCWSFPGGGPGAGNDFGLCQLALPQRDVAIVPPLMGCEVAALEPGAEVTIVGFGLTPEGDYGVKHAVTTTINAVVDAEADIGGDGRDSCQGDSGGPVFIKLSDAEGWRVFGITSYGSADCASGGFYSLVHAGMPWFEQTAQRDLTPCHTADGTWDPDPRCTAFPIDPAAGGGQWQFSCEPGPLTGVSASCGLPFDEPPDVDPPTVAIAEPAAGAQYTSEATSQLAAVRVEIDAFDPGWGLEQVELVVDGEAVGGATDAMEPFGFEVALAPGVYELVARATDYARNTADSDPVVIGVDERPPVIPGADDEGDQSCQCRASAPPMSLMLLVLPLARSRSRSRSRGRNRSPT